MIKKVIKKFLLPNSNQDHTSYSTIPPSSVLLNPNCFDFRIGRENRKYVKVGKKCLIKANFIFETMSGEVKIGNNVHLGGVNFICKTSITIGNDVTMAWDITIYDHNSHSVIWEERSNDNHQCYKDYWTHNANNIVNKDWSNVKTSPIVIKDKVWVGFGVTILKGVTIGEGAVIGAKSVITKDVPAWSVVAGNPAKVVKQLPNHNNL